MTREELGGNGPDPADDLVGEITPVSPQLPPGYDEAGVDSELGVTVEPLAAPHAETIGQDDQDVIPAGEVAKGDAEDATKGLDPDEVGGLVAVDQRPSGSAPVPLLPGAPFTEDPSSLLGVSEPDGSKLTHEPDASDAVPEVVIVGGATSQKAGQPAGLKDTKEAVPVAQSRNEEDGVISSMPLAASSARMEEPEEGKPVERIADDEHGGVNVRAQNNRAKDPQGGMPTEGKPPTKRDGESDSDSLELLTGPTRTVQETDSPEFREASLLRVHEVLGRQLDNLRVALASGDPRQLYEALTDGSDSVARAALGAMDYEEIHGSNETGIILAGLLSVLERPDNAEQLRAEIMSGLSYQYCAGRIDGWRLANGIYLTDIMLQRYYNANKRVARADRLLIDRALSGQALTEADTRAVLKIESTATRVITGVETHKLIGADIERLMLGACYYALHLGIEYDEIVEKLRLNSIMPEAGVAALAERLGRPETEVKAGYIRYLALESDLSWSDL